MKRLRRSLVTAAQFVGMLALLAAAMATYDTSRAPVADRAPLPAAQIAEGGDILIEGRPQDF